MELPNEHNGQRNDKRAERAHAGKPDDQPAVRGLTGGLAGGFLGGLLRCLLRGLLLGLPLELGLPFFLGLLFLCGFRFGGKPLFFCLLGLRLLFGEAGFFGFLFGLLPFQPHALPMS